MLVTHFFRGFTSPTARQKVPTIAMLRIVLLMAYFFCVKLLWAPQKFYTMPTILSRKRLGKKTTQLQAQF